MAQSNLKLSRSKPHPTDRREIYLQIRNLSKSYLEGGMLRPVLIQADVDIFCGELFAILGKSGSGKSTLLNLISGIDTVDQGEIIVEGRDLTALSDYERTLFRRRRIGFVFQFFNLIPTLSVLENVTLPLELNGASLSDARQRAAALLSAIGLADRQDTFPDRLSGGEQQRVAIARALVHDPQLVLADEPTGNLDEETGREIMELLDRLTRRSGKNLLLVTHSRDAAAIADRIFCLRSGKLVENCQSED